MDGEVQVRKRVPRVERAAAEEQAVGLVSAVLEAREVHGLEYKGHLVMARCLERFTTAWPLEGATRFELPDGGEGPGGEPSGWAVAAMACGDIVRMRQGDIANSARQLLGSEGAAAKDRKLGDLGDEGAWLDGTLIGLWQRELLDLDSGALWRVRSLRDWRHPVALAWAALKYGQERWVRSPGGRFSGRLGVFSRGFGAGVGGFGRQANGDEWNPFDEPLSMFPLDEVRQHEPDQRRLALWRELYARGLRRVAEERIPAQVIPLSKLKSPKGDLSPHLIRYLLEEHPNYQPPGAHLMFSNLPTRRMTHQEVADILGYHVDSVGRAVRKLRAKGDR